LAAVYEFSGQQQPGEGSPGHVEVQDPPVMLGVAVLLRAPPSAEAEVEQLRAGERREADAAAEALVAVVVIQRVFGRLIFPAVGDPGGGVEPGCELVGGLEARQAHRPPEAVHLGRCRRQVQGGVVALVAERGVEASERERQPVADGRDAGDVEAVQADLGRDRLVAKLLDAGVAQSRTTNVWIEAVAVAVAVALHLEARAGREPRRERLVGADRELVESEVETAGLRADPRVARELGHHLDAGVVVRRADEEPRDADAPDLGLRQPGHFGRVLPLVMYMALGCMVTRRWRGLGRLWVSARA